MHVPCPTYHRDWGWNRDASMHLGVKRKQQILYHSKNNIFGKGGALAFFLKIEIEIKFLESNKSQCLPINCHPRL